MPPHLWGRPRIHRHDMAMWPKVTAAQELCTDSWGSWCQSTYYGYSCPVTCATDETLVEEWEADVLKILKPMVLRWFSCPGAIHPHFFQHWGRSLKLGIRIPCWCCLLRHLCYATPYDEYGNIDWSAVWQDLEAGHGHTMAAVMNSTWCTRSSDTFQTFKGRIGGIANM